MRSIKLWDMNLMKRDLWNRVLVLEQILSLYLQLELLRSRTENQKRGKEIVATADMGIGTISEDTGTDIVGADPGLESATTGEQVEAGLGLGSVIIEETRGGVLATSTKIPSVGDPGTVATIGTCQKRGTITRKGIESGTTRGKEGQGHGQGNVIIAAIETRRGLGPGLTHALGKEIVECPRALIGREGTEETDGEEAGPLK